MRVLGIDPGLDTTGYGVIESTSRGMRIIEAGVIRTVRTTPLAERLQKIHEQVTILIRQTQPTAAVLEQLYAHYKHPSTAILMGHARGVVCLACTQQRLTVKGYLPTRIKKAVVGKGHATKAQVRHMLSQYLGLGEVAMPDDASDALAIALSYFFIEMRMGYDRQNTRPS